jgi:hypothetical protein
MPKTIWIPECDPKKGYFKSRFGTTIDQKSRLFEAGKRYVVDDATAERLAQHRQRDGDPDSRPLFVIMNEAEAREDAERRANQATLGSPGNPIVIASEERDGPSTSLEASPIPEPARRRPAPEEPTQGGSDAAGR